ncbi:MAG TPA: CYTH domain-containing protein [Rhodocyclaceae bacterium]|nr:CYTH domain-containing protein [Rhodocyclaceae bacterium]
MGREIERRFLVADRSIVDSRDGAVIVQGYLRKDSGEMNTRIRICGSLAWLTLKAPHRGLVRDEYEYPIPLGDAREILERHCVGRTVQKTRYAIPSGRHVFDVDVFEGSAAGLVIAEVELSAPDEVVEIPSWIGLEISGDSRYGNRSLALHGFPDACAPGHVPHPPTQKSETIMQLA